jgi:hypothetical protein
MRRSADLISRVLRTELGEPHCINQYFLSSTRMTLWSNLVCRDHRLAPSITSDSGYPRLRFAISEPDPLTCRRQAYLDLADPCTDRSPPLNFLLAPSPASPPFSFALRPATSVNILPQAHFLYINRLPCRVCVHFLPRIHSTTHVHFHLTSLLQRLQSFVYVPSHRHLSLHNSISTR